MRALAPLNARWSSFVDLESGDIVLLPAKYCYRTRLLQVLVKDDGEWKIAAYHNVDVKSGVEGARTAIRAERVCRQAANGVESEERNLIS
jgi:hypothetical protein